MNRRNFFKAVTGFVAGVLFAPKALAEKPVLTLAKLMKVKEALDATIEDDFLIPVDKELFLAYTNKSVNPPILIYEDISPKPDRVVFESGLWMSCEDYEYSNRRDAELRKQNNE